MRFLIILLLVSGLLWSHLLSAQNIGINETGANPHGSAILDVSSTNKGMLIPRLTTAQRTGIAGPANGLLVYDTSTSSFWFYDGGAWVELVSGTLNGNTLDEAYDEGGAGAGRIISADAGVVSVQGTDGIEVTGTFGSGAGVGNPGAGTRMFFNPRKAAFRAGSVTFNQWNDANVGDYSIGLGRSAEATGMYDAAIGFGARATGTYSTAIGWANHASGPYSLALGGDSDASGFGSVAIGRLVESSGSHAFSAGLSTVASGESSSAFGNSSTASGDYSFASGYLTYAEAQNVSVFGRYNVGGGNPTSWIATDPLFEVGNGSSPSNLSNAFTILKNGNVGLSTTNPSATLDVEGTFQLVDGNEAAGRVLTSDASGNATWTDPGASGGTLDEAYDFGGAGAGRIITADGGVVSLQGTDGIEVTGTFGSGASVGSPGAGTRMFFNPRKAAFRAGTVSGNEWNNGNLGDNSVAFGESVTASGEGSAAFNIESTASGFGSVAFGNSVAIGSYSMATGTSNTTIGASSFSGGNESTATANNSLAFGQNTETFGQYSVALNFHTTATAYASTAIGRYNVGGGNFGSWVGTDPLFEIGIGTSNSFKANAFTVLKNGNTGIMTATPDATLDVVGTFQLVDGTEGANRVLTSDANGNATWAAPATGGNTLDEAYDQGGAGAGRTINAENGAVHINKNASATGSALEISVNSTYNLNERSAISTTNALTGLETYTNINGTPGPPYGQAFLITHDPSANIIGLDGIAIELNQSSALNYLGESRGFLYDVTYNGGSSASIYGYQANIEGSGGALKYGAHITIPSSSGGTHYGIYSDVQNASGYAAYLVGRTSLGTGASNRYLMPAADGTSGQVMTTDGVGNVSWATPASGGGTLDEAYDNGGPGSGRNITADAGAVSVQGTDGFEVTGTFNSGAAIGNPGAGTRMFYNPRKAAFRAGRVTATQWNDANVGVGSAAFGFNNIVSGSYSVAFGSSNQAISPSSVVMGENSQAQGAFSIAMGGFATAIGESAIAMGESSTANGDLSIAFSEGTANGASSIAHGRGVIADGDYEFATGEFNTTYTPSDDLTDRAFVVGNGTGPAARSNALILQKNGLLTINDAFTLPNTDGNEGEVMVTDGAGTVSWSGPVAFSAYQSVDIASSVASDFPVNTEEFDTGNNFNPATATFTAPADGIYQFNFVEFSNLTSGALSTLQVRLNGIVNRSSVLQSSGALNHRFVFIMELTAGDQVQFDHAGLNRTMYGASNSAARCTVEGFMVR